MKKKRFHKILFFERNWVIFFSLGSKQEEKIHLKKEKKVFFFSVKQNIFSLLTVVDWVVVIFFHKLWDGWGIFFLSVGNKKFPWIFFMCVERNVFNVFCVKQSREKNILRKFEEDRNKINLFRRIKYFSYKILEKFLFSMFGTEWRPNQVKKHF